MPVIAQNQFKDHLDKWQRTGFPSLYLIHGEELFCKQVANELVNAILPADIRDIGHEIVSNDDLNEAIELVSTFSITGTKVVTLPDTRMFYSRQDDQRLIDKAKEAFKAGKHRHAAAQLLKFLAIHKLSVDDMSEASRRNIPELSSVFQADDQWVDELIQYCREHDLKPRSSADEVQYFQKIVENGFAEDNYLIITTDVVDKRRTLYKSIEKYGVIIDCHVSHGNLKADKESQQAALIQQMRSILGQHNKQMDQNAWAMLYDMIGFDPRTLTTSLEKLAAYVGNRKTITKDDIQAVLQRTKQDPIYEITNAVSDRDATKALFFLESLLNSGVHPLQILAAITNVVRRLMVARDFLSSPDGKQFHPKMTYSMFRQAVLPAVLAYDDHQMAALQTWDEMLTQKQTTKPAKKKKVTTDLKLIKNPKSPFPVYSLLKNASKFSMEELVTSLATLADADYRLKSSGTDSLVLLVSTIMAICGSGQTP